MLHLAYDLGKKEMKKKFSSTDFSTQDKWCY